MPSRNEPQAAMKLKLITGWEWMKRNPTHPELDDFFNDRFMPLLAIYDASFGEDAGEEAAVAQLLRMEKKLPEPSPWVEELRAQLTLLGADVDPAPTP
jgi:hypothetical protein